MTAITDSRKRSREEDGSDFMPLSKRITNLHINASSTPMQDDITDYNTTGGNMNLSQQQQHNLTLQQQILQFQNSNHFGAFSQPIEANQFLNCSNLIDAQERQLQYQQYLNECNNASSRNGSACTNVSSSDNGNHLRPYDPYDPELSQEENPFYYNKNKLLYDLYLERCRRHQ